MMWPFDRGGLLLALYVATLALHAVFIGYVVAGTGFALVRRHDPIAATVRDRLPFMLGCGITAGVAPLLFLQLLHQKRFYTANLLLGPRWMAVVPALVVGFYALYAAKSLERYRQAALGIALACFTFVAWSWSELHELMKADATWRAFYSEGQRLFVAGTILPRLVVFGGAMATTFALIAAWSTDAAGRKRLALLGLLSRVVSIGGAVWLWRAGFDPHGPARAWAFVLIAATVIDVAAWAALVRAPSDAVLGLATASGAGAIVAASIVREAPRVALIEPTHPIAANAGGIVVFLVAFSIGVAAIAWVVRTVREGPR
jgi:hypothetical protein